MEKKYKRYRTIHRIAYITLFTYILALALANVDLGEYFPFFIVVPFLGYCIIAIITEIMVQRFWKRKKEMQKSSLPNTESGKVESSVLSKA